MSRKTAKQQKSTDNFREKFFLAILIKNLRLFQLKATSMKIISSINFFVRKVRSRNQL